MDQPPLEPASPAAPAPEPGAGAVPRRSFLGLATACLGACAGASALGVVGLAVVGTPLRDAAGRETGWLDLGPLARFPDGAPAKVAVTGEVRDAWTVFPSRVLGNVLVVRRGDDATVFSATCPHNGCDVFVAEGGGAIGCPCHDSRFTLEGAVDYGPSPRPLDALEAEVAAGRLRVRYQRFEVGIAEQRPL